MPRALLLPAILFLLNCSKSDISNTFIDSRDNQRYKFAKIGDLLWMAENLNYKPKDSLNSWCYGDIKSNCKKYGRLYDWEAAKKVCPKGWRLPSHYEWRNLSSNDTTDGKELKSQTGWNNSDNGTDSLGFSALPSGCRRHNGEFAAVGGCSFWWLAAERGPYRYNAYSICSKSDYCYDDVIERDIYNKSGYSVRCVRRDYAPDIAIAMQAEENTKEISHFEDYENRLDSLLIAGYKTIPLWCGTMAEDSSDLKSRYLEISSRKDYFLKYYDERCAKPAEEFELLTTGIEFKSSLGYRFSISLSKTSTGAFAKYSLDQRGMLTERMEIELGQEEWQGFIKALYKCCVAKWEDFNVAKWEDLEQPVNSLVRIGGWRLSIISLGKETVEYGGIPERVSLDLPKRPLNWFEFRELLENLEAKMLERTGAVTTGLPRL